MHDQVGAEPLNTSAGAVPREGCVLCGGKPRWLNVFVPAPKFQRVMGAPAGKRFVTTYLLCKRCKRKPGVLQRVERKLLAPFTVAAN
jgi:hypothetical protein